jgi:hypothetical protein
VNPSRLLAAALVAAGLGGIVAVTLQERVASVRDVPIARAVPGGPAEAVALTLAIQPDLTRRAHADLHLARPHTLVDHGAVQLMMVTYGATRPVQRAEIRVVGTDCVYRARPDTVVSDHAYLTFDRADSCRAPLPDSATGRLDLTIDFRGPGRIGLVTDIVSEAAFDPRWWAVPANGPPGAGLVRIVRGRYVDALAGPPRRRVELLAYVWQGSTSPGWIWLIVALALASVFVGILAVMPGAGPPRMPSAGPRLRPALGVGAVATGFALLYVVIAPPLQAADEPDHLLGFAKAVDRPALQDQAAALARASHFDRIRFHGDEHFGPADIGRPATIAWTSEVFAHSVAARSVTTWLWWRALAPVTRPFGAGGTILAIRLADALLFGAAASAAAFLLLLAASGTAASPHSACLALLMVPTLPFFATSVSEFAVLTSVYMVLAATLGALCLDTERSHVLGLPLGLAIALAVASGRSALPMGPVILGAVAARALLGGGSGDSTRTARRHTFEFWGGLALGLGLFPLLSTQEFRGGLEPGDASATLGRAQQAAEYLRRHPAIVLAVAPIGFACDLFMERVRRAIPDRWTGVAARWLRVLCYLGALAIVGSLVASFAVRFPDLPTLESFHPVSAVAYARSVLKVALTGFRLTAPDLLLSSSFWIGFGWIDTLPGAWIVSLLVGLTAAALVGLLARLGYRREWRRAVWLACMAGGWLGALVLYAVSSYRLNRNLHGRYLVGFYLSVLAVSWGAVGLPPRWRPTGAWGAHLPGREWALVALAAGLHACSLRFILLRYF